MTEPAVGSREPPALGVHLRAWLGAWPPRTRLEVVGSAERSLPGWDGRVDPLVGVLTPAGGVVSVPADAVPAARELLAAGRWERLGAAVGRPGWPVEQTILRWSTEPARLPDGGRWVSIGHPEVPEWLRPFGPEVLVALDVDGRYLAGVGGKRHPGGGVELAVGTEPYARGAGLARRLIAQAARAALAEGSVPTYRHHLGNLASARVAEAAGFPDRGWRHLGLAEAP